jgi:acid phosphatase type 7
VRHVLLLILAAALLTGAAPASRDPVVVAAGDIACDRGPGPGICRQAATARLVEAQHPDSVLVLGDLQYEKGSLADFRRWYGPTWGRFRARTHPVPGNHEYGTEGAAGYKAYFGVTRTWRSFDLGGWHIVGLDSECDKVGGCERGSPQERWLRADLARTQARCILAYWHRPRTQAFWDDLAAAGADVVLSGHDHDYERLRPRDGIHSFVVGTGGRSLYPLRPFRFGSERAWNGGFGVLRLGLHEGWYDWRFLSVPGGRVFEDTGRADCS